MTMFYLSAILAITGVVGYQYFLKRVPESLNPIFSIIAMYIIFLVLSAILWLFFPAEGGFQKHLRQINWIQIVLAACVISAQLGFLLMYRNGWNLGTGNIVTGVFVNIILVGLGVTLLGEKLSSTNGTGIVLCSFGVALISMGS